MHDNHYEIDINKIYKITTVPKLLLDEHLSVCFYLVKRKNNPLLVCSELATNTAFIILWICLFTVPNTCTFRACPESSQIISAANGNRTRGNWSCLRSSCLSSHAYSVQSSSSNAFVLCIWRPVCAEEFFYTNSKIQGHCFTRVWERVIISYWHEIA